MTVKELRARLNLLDSAYDDEPVIVVIPQENGAWGEVTTVTVKNHTFWGTRVHLMCEDDA